MKEYYVIFEWTGNNYSAYVPDLAGYISTSKTLELYIEILKEDGKVIPEPSIKAKAICIGV